MRVVTVVGARPQFVKAAAMTAAIERWNSGHRRAIDQAMVHTGQHYDANMSDVFFSELMLPVPAFNLGVGSGPHGAQTGEMLERLEPVVIELRPDLVLLFGDTNSTLAGALVAAKLGIPVAHVEAGLRSGRRDMPEEVNRVVSDHLASHLFCPSELAVANLTQEGITEGVVLTGDVMLDVLERHRPHLGTTALATLGLEPRCFALATVHRAGNTDVRHRLLSLLQGFNALAAKGLTVVFPAHPRTAKALTGCRVEARVHIIEPLGYRTALELASASRVVITDSGGLQKEAYWLGVPCVTVREETEWPETVVTGWNTLVGTDPQRMLEAALKDAPPLPRPPVYGRGDAADRIVATLAETE